MGIRRLESTGSFTNESFQQSWRASSSDLEMESPHLPLLNHTKSKNYSEGVEPQVGVTLSWHDLSVYVPVKKTGFKFFKQSNSDHKRFKRVLNNANGIIHPGTLMAVMGASGAGKTTLLNVLAKRAPGNVIVNGDIRVNGIPIGKFMRKISGYVYQEDLFFESLTVKEHLNFMARMKLDRRLTSWERQRRVEELLMELSLKKCEGTRIHSISGGEKKRLAFASEVISGCPLLFADECTTGLDSFSALRIVGVMRTLSAKGKTIICTIHQPSSPLFSLFDQLCLLAEGRTAYLGATKDALPFLSSLGYDCPEHFNPADFYIRTLAVFPGKEEESRRIIRKICDAFANSKQAQAMEDEIAEEIVRYDFADMSTSVSSKSTDFGADQTILGKNIRKPLWLTQFYWLMWRALVDSARNPKIHTVRTLQKIALALLIGFCYFGITIDQKGIQDVQGAIFIFITENTFPAMYGVLHVFPTELPLFLREHKNGLYGVDVYYLSKMLSLVPGFIVEPLIFVTIAYWMVGLRATTDAFFLTCLILILTSNTAAACGCFFSAAFDTVSVAITCLIPFDYMLMITGGLFINLESLPGYLSWTKFLSWFMYSNEGISVIQWRGVNNITCDPNPDIPCERTGEEVLESRSFDQSNIPQDIIAMLCIYLTFHLGAFLSLLIKSNKK